MKIALVTNGFFVTQKTEEIRRLLADAFASRGEKVVGIKNDEILAGSRIDVRGISAALFWDKDWLLAAAMENAGIKVINSSSALKICDDKGIQAVYAVKSGLPTPKTMVAPFSYANIGYGNFDFLNGVVAELDFPIVVKETHGSFGQQVYLAKNYDELLSLVKKISPSPMLFQQYIECGSSDLRLQVVGGKVVAAVRRTSRGDFRANATLGGIMTAYAPSSAETELAIAAADVVGAEIAGVDILPGKTPLLCEVNANAHFKRLMDATGIDVAAIIAEYVLSRV